MRTLVYPADKKHDFSFAIMTIDKEAVAIEQEVMNNRVGQNVIYALPWADAVDRFITSGIIYRLSFAKRVIFDKKKSMVKSSDGAFMYYWLVLNKAPLK